MTVEQAKQRLASLANEEGFVYAAAVEGDEQLSANREITAAAAHQLATESGVSVGEETDSREWFPYSFIRFES